MPRSCKDRFNGGKFFLLAQFIVGLVFQSFCGLGCWGMKGTIIMTFFVQVDTYWDYSLFNNGILLTVYPMTDLVIGTIVGL